MHRWTNSDIEMVLSEGGFIPGPIFRCETDLDILSPNDCLPQERKIVNNSLSPSASEIDDFDSQLQAEDIMAFDGGCFCGDPNCHGITDPLGQNTDVEENLDELSLAANEPEDTFIFDESNVYCFECNENLCDCNCPLLCVECFTTIVEIPGQICQSCFKLITTQENEIVNTAWGEFPVPKQPKFDY